VGARQEEKGNLDALETGGKSQRDEAEHDQTSKKEKNPKKER